MTDWYRERPFKVAFVASLLIHAALIGLVPGFRAVVFEPPKVLDVEIILPEQPLAPPTPVSNPLPPQRILEETPLQPESKVEPRPEPALRQPEAEPPPIARAEIAPPPPEPVVVPNPEPRIEPKIEIAPEPKSEPRPEPPPVARVEPLPEPRREVRPEPQPVSQEPPTPVAEATVPPAPVAVPVPSPAPPPPLALKKEPTTVVEPRLLVTYGLSISNEIRRYQKYPPMAQRRGWEGTAEVLLQIAADGKVTSITLAKSSGRQVLDEEALNMVRKAKPLPPAPQDLRGRELTVIVPIVFKLQS
jgi:protein TonB